MRSRLKKRSRSFAAPTRRRWPISRVVPRWTPIRTVPAGISSTVCQRRSRRAIWLSWAFRSLHGSYETVAELIATLEPDTGIGGLLLTFIDFVPDIRRFGEKVLPLVRERYAAINAAA